ncbi:MAG: hypothetical protein V7642_5284 [Burkholderiales bacterium]
MAINGTVQLIIAEWQRIYDNAPDQATRQLAETNLRAHRQWIEDNDITDGESTGGSSEIDDAPTQFYNDPSRPPGPQFYTDPSRPPGPQFYNDPTIDPTIDPTGDPFLDPGLDPNIDPPSDSGQELHGSPNPFSTAPQIGQLSYEEGKRMAINIARQLMIDFPGMTKEQAAGIAGNLWHESAGMNANVNEFGSSPGSDFGPPNATQFGYGWAQWTGSRKTDYLNYCSAHGLDPSSPAANYEFLKHELRTSESQTLPAIFATSTPEDAAVEFRRVFERATNPVDHARMKAAGEIYAAL